MRYQRRSWIENGKVHNRNDDYFVKYKEAKRILRKQHRRCKQTLIDTKFQELYEAAEVDANEYCKTAKRSKRKKRLYYETCI